MIEFLHRRRNENDKMIDDKQPSEDVVVVVPDPHLLEENEANANGFFGQHYLSIAPPRPLTSTSHVKWAVAHGDILIQQRSFESQRALTACWQTSRENGLFPCILCDQSVHFLTLNTPPTCMPLAEPYDGIFAFGPGVLLHNSETNAMALIRAPFHVEVTPETLEVRDVVCMVSIPCGVHDTDLSMDHQKPHDNSIRSLVHRSIDPCGSYNHPVDVGPISAVPRPSPVSAVSGHPIHSIGLPRGAATHVFSLIRGSFPAFSRMFSIRRCRCPVAGWPKPSNETPAAPAPGWKLGAVDAEQ
jgi:hypothetical protein